MDWALVERIVCELVVLSILNWLPTRRLGSIDRALRLLRVDVRQLARELARHRNRATRRLNGHDDRLDRHETRINAHDQHAGIDTRSKPVAP